MQLPANFTKSLRGTHGFDEEAFIEIHEAALPLTSVRLNPLKGEHVWESFQDKKIQLEEVPWETQAYYLSPRPSFTFDPLFHAGCYYVQEASSMLAGYALQQTIDIQQPLKVLDLCAAPGGKSTHLQSLLSKESLLVSNEVIRQRVNVLKDNLVKWGSHNVMVTHNDPKDFSRLKGYFDVILVDAPCSGSGLFRRDANAMDEWSEEAVTLCSQRQQRILADVMPALKEGGILIYSTCSYSRQEDEDIMDWLSDSFSLTNIRLNIPTEWGITEAMSERHQYGYRCWPHQVKGEGFFLSVFRNDEGASYKNKGRVVVKPATRQLRPLLQKWANLTDQELIQVNHKVYSWAPVLLPEFDVLLQHFRVIYSGTLLGELAHQKLIPDHALAMSPLCGSHLEKVELDEDNAIAYLRKQNFTATIPTPGWKLVTYRSHNLGWINALQNRINNYYPKELRIFK